MDVRQIPYFYVPQEKLIFYTVVLTRWTKQIKTKRLQRLKQLNTKAAKYSGKFNHRAEAPVKRMNVLHCNL